MRDWPVSLCFHMMTDLWVFIIKRDSSLLSKHKDSSEESVSQPNDSEIYAHADRQITFMTHLSLHLRITKVLETSQ